VVRFLQRAPKGRATSHRRCGSLASGIRWNSRAIWTPVGGSVLSVGQGSVAVRARGLWILPAGNSGGVARNSSLVNDRDLGYLSISVDVVQESPVVVCGVGGRTPRTDRVHGRGGIVRRRKEKTGGREK
jgi:hypothetical protein